MNVPPQRHSGRLRRPFEPANPRIFELVLRQTPDNLCHTLTTPARSKLHSMNLKTLLTYCGLAALSVGALSLQAENKIPEDCKTGGFFIGCQAYTFNHFSVFE